MRTFDYEKYKEYKTNGEIVTLIAEIYELKGRQNFFIDRKPAILDSLAITAKINSTEASNNIEGIVTTADRISSLLKKKSEPKNRAEEEIIGYRDVLNTIHENYQYVELKPSVILQLHRDLLKFTTLSYGGQFKNTDNVIAVKENGKTNILFEPLKPYEAPTAIGTICDEYLKALENYKIEPLILICVFIHDFLCVHPFNDGNGRMSRLLTLLLLYKNEFAVGKYISIEKLIEKTKANYYEALKESSENWHEAKDDKTPFIKYMLQIILAAYREFESRVMAVEKSKLSKPNQVKKVIADNIGKITKHDISELCPHISEPTIKSTLAKLVQEGYIKKVGSGKNSGYVKI